MTISSNVVLGYHGCEIDVAQELVLGDKQLEPSENAYDWLGHGTYFWEDDPVRARLWADERDYQYPTVVGAVIRLGFCLDLVQVENLQLVKKSYDRFRFSFENVGLLHTMPENKPGFDDDEDLVKCDLDCAVLNFLHESRAEMNEPPFDTVRSPFSEGDPLYEGGKIMERTHIQICVREQKNILGYFWPRHLTDE
jgi:hypothetical protein